MLKNKHIIVAMLVAPVLAILGWFAVDYFVAERPQAARSGASYPLVAKSNCRYDSGRCDLENADFEISLRLEAIESSTISLLLESRFPLQGATVGLAGERAELPAVTMSARNGERTIWSAVIAAPAGDDSFLRVAVVADDTTFFAEVPVVFLVIQD